MIFKGKKEYNKQLKKEFGNENGNYGQRLTRKKNKKTKIKGETSNVQFKLKKFEQTRK